ncbi:MAG: nucleoside deaminase [Verrucomicrobiae bacterium]|nr:nucleoside deaminase [Verrucomicrobiae bacterium]MCB1090402.1 nucleoside deaminase [Verrucomicrobiae bacterium]
MDAPDQTFLARAVALARESMERGQGGPFGAVIVRDGQILAEATNRVTVSNDPTAHAEIEAIRGAARSLSDFRLHGCTLYASCEPCPMCLSAASWARVDRIVFGAGRAEAAKAGFDDAFLYEEMARPLSDRSLPITSLPSAEASAVLADWVRLPAKIPY